MTQEPVTPELALVDPVLRRRLLAGVPIDVPQHLRRGGRSAVRALPARLPSTPEPIRSRALYTRRLTSPLAIAACSSLATLGLVIAAVELKPDRAEPTLAAAPTRPKPAHQVPSTHKHRVAPRPVTSPAATTPAATTPAATTPVVTTPAPRKKPSAPPPKPHVMRFSWPAVSGAVSYDVSFYTRGTHSRLVLQLHPRTPSAVITVARGATGGAALAPGAYRWDVWPVTRSGRSSVAVVQSSLDVP